MLVRYNVGTYKCWYGIMLVHINVGTVLFICNFTIIFKGDHPTISTSPAGYVDETNFGLFSSYCSSYCMLQFS